MRVDRVPIHRRLGVQLSLAVTLVMVAALGATGWALLSEQRESLRRELTLRVLAETRSLALAASAPLLRHDPELGLHPLILRAMEESPDLQDLVVLDARGLVQGHRELLHVGEPFALPDQGTPLAVPLAASERAFVDGSSIVVTQDIVHLDQTIGTLVATIGPARIDRAVHDAERHLFVIGGAGIGLVLLSVLGLVALQLRPLGPLRDAMTRIGRGDLGTRVPSRSADELGMLAALVNSMAEGLENAQGELIQKERLDRELEIAHDLQSTLLPSRIDPPAGYGIGAHYTAATEVSGDYYDVLRIDDDHMAFVVADVSGKGVPGLVVMAMLRVILRGLSRPGREPAPVLQAASRMLEGTMRRGMFVTCCYGILDLRTHTFDYVSAGHCPPILVEDGRARELESRGKALGMFPTPIFAKSLRPHRVRLEPGQTLLLYTDGLVEAMDPSGRQLGVDPVLELAGAARDAEGLVDTLRATVEGHRQGAVASDDLTLVAIGREPVPVTATVTS